jgi:hypothetical protein
MIPDDVANCHSSLPSFGLTAFMKPPSRIGASAAIENIDGQRAYLSLVALQGED